MEPAAAAAVPGVVGCLRGAWAALTDDPLGLLVPTGGLLLADAVLFEAVRDRALDDWRGAALLLAARPLVHAPFRARLVAVAARGTGHPATPWGRPIALAGADLAAWPIVLAAFLAGAGAGAVAGTVAANEGWFGTAAALFAAGCLGGSAAALALRALFAYAAWEVAVGGRSSLGALRASIARGPADTATALALLAIGDGVVLVAGLLCGALLLPGYPLSTLAVTVRAAASDRT